MDNDVDAPRNWRSARTPKKRYDDAGPTLEAIDRLMDGLRIPSAMKKLIQIFMAREILQPDEAGTTANEFLDGLPPEAWTDAIAAEKNRLR